ncbi:MAG: MlaD family protein [Desulfomonile sp.]|nr:MlaD family protein [Desulfomonile sp.]
MAGQAQKFKIGLFVVVSLLLGSGLLIWLGAGRYFSPTQKVVAYFNESVQGLEPDSAVKFRGVNVGRVDSIRMAPDAQLVEVVMNLDKSFRVSEDLGIKISLLGITGMKYLEMDRYEPPLRRDPPQLEFQPRYPVITTYPSEIREFGDALDTIFRKVRGVDLERISAHLLNVSARLDRILADPKVQDIGAETAETIQQIKKASKRVNDELDRMSLGKRVGTTLDKSSEFLQEITGTARSLDQMIHRTDISINRLSQKLDRSADNLVDLTKMLKNKPSIILFGSPPEKAEKKP